MDGLNAYYTACLKNAMPDSFTSLIDAPNTAYHYYPSLHRDINDKIGECILSHVVAICCNAVLEKKGLEDDRFAKRFDIDILDKAKVFGIDLHEPPITLRKDKNAPEGYNLTLTLSDEVAHEASKITDFAHNLRELPEIDEVIYEDKELLYISSSHTTAKVKKAVKTLLQSLGIEI